MAIHILLLISVVFFALALSRALHRRFLTPLTIVVVWWSFWLIVSMYGLSGIDIPSDGLYFLAECLLYSIVLGYALAGFGLRYGAIKAPSVKRQAQVGKELLPKLVAIGLLVFIAPFLIKAWGFLAGGQESTGDYRNLMLGSSSEGSGIFDTVAAYVLYTSFFSPLLFILVMFGITRYAIDGKKGVLVISLALLAVDGFINLGRFGFYFAIIIFVCATWIVGIRKGGLISRVRIGRPANGYKKYVAVVLVLLGLVYISVLRLGGESGLDDVVYHMMEYHNIGFALLDKELVNPGSFLNTNTTYGRATFGGLDEYVVLILKRFFDGIEPIRHVVGTYQNTFVDIGVSNSGDSLFYNAYYTSIYTLYLDGGVPGVVLGGLFFGYFVWFLFSRFLKYGDGSDLYRLLLIIYLGFFSIFSCPLIGSKFWVAVLASFVLKFGVVSRPSIGSVQTSERGR